MSFLLPNPPDVALCPAKGLEAYLESLNVMGQQHPCPGDNTISGRDHLVTTNAVKGATSTAPVDTPENTFAGKAGDELAIVRRRNIIQVADCLFGTVLLEGAIATLHTRNTTEIVSVQSRRRMFILTSIAKKKRRSGLAKRHDKPHHYFCLLPYGTRSEDAGNKQNQQTSLDKLDFYFCSCRSYLERNSSIATDTPCTRNQFVGTHADSNSKYPQFNKLCKHLLALKLRPFLAEAVEPCNKVETVTEAQFSQVVLRSLFGGRNFAHRSRR